MATLAAYLGIDVGTTNLKGAAFCADTGSLLGTSASRLVVSTAPDGQREQDLRDLRRGLLECCRGLLQALPLGTEIKGIGIAAQGGSGAIVDQAGGGPLTPMLLWNDSRPLPLLPDIAAQMTDAYWRDLSQRNGPGAGLAKIKWLCHHCGQSLEDGQLYVGAGEYTFHQLTGVWRQDPCNALQMGCYRVLEDRLTETPLQLVGASLKRIAPLRNGHTTRPLSSTAAAELGLPEGIPVAGPYMDHEAGYMSAARISSRPLQCSLGTAWVGNFVLPPGCTGWAPVQLVIPSPAAPGRLVVQPLLTGNVSWDWALGSLLHSEHAQALELCRATFERELLPPRGLTCVPWCTQRHPIVPGLLGGGSFCGLSAHTSRDDLLRGVAAGLAFEFARVFEMPVAKGGIDAIVLGGGASKGTFFQTLFAALFDQLPLATLADEDLAGARGTLYPFRPDLAASEARPVAPAPPDVCARVQEQYDDYRTVFDRLYGNVESGHKYDISDGKSVTH